MVDPENCRTGGVWVPLASAARPMTSVVVLVPGVSGLATVSTDPWTATIR